MISHHNEIESHNEHPTPSLHTAKEYLLDPRIWFGTTALEVDFGSTNWKVSTKGKAFGVAIFVVLTV